MHWRHTSARIWKIEKWRSKIQKPGPIGMHGYHVATNCLQSTASLTKFAQLLKSDCHFSYEIFVNRLRLYFHVEVVYKSPLFSLGIFLCLSFGLMMVVKYLNRKQIDTTFTHGQKLFVVLALLIKKYNLYVKKSIRNQQYWFCNTFISHFCLSSQIEYDFRKIL